MKSKSSYVFALAGLPFLCIACGASAPSKELVTARTAYANLNQSGAALVNPTGAREATEAMEKAEAAHRDDEGSEQEIAASYIATRKSELAMAQADAERARQDREKADLEYQAQLEQQLRSTHGQLQSAQAATAKAARDQVNWQRRGEDMVVSLSGVSFNTGGHTLSAEAKRSLDDVARSLKLHPDRDITIAGFTDSTGAPEKNRALSQKRADTVKDYLASRGVPSSRLSSEGRGDRDPIASNDTPTGRAENRRVEIMLHPQGEGSERQPVKGIDSPEMPTPKQR